MNEKARTFFERMCGVWARLTGRSSTPDALQWHGHSQSLMFMESKEEYDTLMVEFVGGPFDGHAELLHSTERSARLFIPVSRAILKMLDGETANWEDPPTSMALYELEKTGPNYWYRFCYPSPPHTRSLHLH